jgi:hypothetical protein
VEAKYGDEPFYLATQHTQRRGRSDLTVGLHASDSNDLALLAKLTDTSLKRIKLLDELLYRKSPETPYVAIIPYAENWPEDRSAQH